MSNCSFNVPCYCIWQDALFCICFVLWNVACQLFLYLMSGWSRYKWRDSQPTLTVSLYGFRHGFPSGRVRDTQTKAAVEKLYRIIINWPQDETKSQGLYLLCSHASATLFHPCWCFSPSSFNMASEWDISISVISFALFQSLCLFLFLLRFIIAFGLFFLFIFCLCTKGQRGVWGTAVAYESPETRLFGVWQRRDRTRLHLHNIYEGPFGWNLQ